MVRTKGWIWISLALICALGAGGLAYYMLQQQRIAAEAAISAAQQRSAVAELVTTEIPVAARDLERGTLIQDTDIVVKAFPVELVPSAVITDMTRLSGQILAEPVTQGDLFRERTLYGSEQGPLSAEIAQGRTIIAFPIVDLFAGTGLLVEGDRIDLLLSVEVEREAQEGAATREKLTGYTVQNVRVMRILTDPPTEENPEPRPTALLLELAPGDAVMVKKVKDAGGTIDLALRSPLDEEPFRVPMVDDDALITLLQGEAETIGGRQ